MNAICEFITIIIRWILVTLTFICVDIPLKLILCCVYLVLSIICGIFYPIFKHIIFPDWVGNVWEYATGFDRKICNIVYDMWS